MPLTTAQDATLKSNEAAVDAAQKALAAGDIANLAALQATLDAAIATQDAFILTLVADPPVVVTPPPPPVTTALTMGTVPPKTFIVGSLITPIQLTATGGTGTGYTYKVNGLTPGLAIVGSQVTGTPTIAEPNTMNFIVTDSAGNTNTGPAVTFTTMAAVVTPPVTPPVVLGGAAPLVNTGQTPSGVTIATNPAMVVNFNQTTLAACLNTATAATSKLVGPFTEGWYGAADANQNETNMIPANVVPTVNGLQLYIKANPTTGGLVSTNSAGGGFAWESAKPFFAQVTFIPQGSPGTWVNWLELWITTVNEWLGESDLCECLGGGMAFHIHDNNGSIAPAGINYSLVAGKNTVGVQQNTNGQRWLFVNGVYKGTLTGAANISPPWQFVLGNSSTPSISGAAVAGFCTVLSAEVFQ